MYRGTYNLLLLLLFFLSRLRLSSHNNSIDNCFNNYTVSLQQNNIQCMLINTVFAVRFS